MFANLASPPRFAPLPTKEQMNAKLTTLAQEAVMKLYPEVIDVSVALDTVTGAEETATVVATGYMASGESVVVEVMVNGITGGLPIAAMPFVSARKACAADEDPVATLSMGLWSIVRPSLQGRHKATVRTAMSGERRVGFSGLSFSGTARMRDALMCQGFAA